jgi:hypothetical protein
VGGRGVSTVLYRIGCIVSLEVQMQRSLEPCRLLKELKLTVTSFESCPMYFCISQIKVFTANLICFNFVLVTSITIPKIWIHSL